VDIFARFQNINPSLQQNHFFGQLQHIYLVRFTEARPALDLLIPTTIIMAAIQNCKVDDNAKIHGLPHFHFYSQLGAMHVLDITCVQSVVARIKTRRSDLPWAISDRSGNLVLASFSEDS
jgi:hypothetical protein